MKQKIGGWPLQLVFTGNSGLFVAVRRYDRRSQSFVVYVDRWNVESGQRKEWGPFPLTGTRSRGGGINEMGKVRLSGDGRFLATTLGQRVLIIDVVTGRQVNIAVHSTGMRRNANGHIPGFFGSGTSGTMIYSLEFDPDGYVLATGALGSPVIRFAPIAGRDSPEELNQPEMESVIGLHFSRSGKLLVASGLDQLPPNPGKGMLHVWRLP